MLLDKGRIHPRIEGGKDLVRGERDSMITSQRLRDE